MKAKKIIAVAVMCIFLISTMAAGAVAKNGNPNVNVQIKDDGSVQVTMNFKDMEQAKWALKHVMKMKCENIIAGYPDRTFRPNKPVTRAEAVVMTLKAAGLWEEVEGTVSESVYLPFKDVKNIPFWARKAVSVAAEKGYIDSGANIDFQPNKPATREWVVRLMAKALNIKPLDIHLPFKDADKISPDMRGYVAAVVYEQLIAGYPDGNFNPHKPVTRAEIAVILGLSTDELEIPRKTANKIKGTIVSTKVYADGSSQGTLTIDVDDEKSVTLPVAKNALIYVDDKPASLANLAAGSKVEVILKEDGLAVYIEVEPVTVKGVVASVYGDKLDVYIFGKGKKHDDAVKTTFMVSSNASVTLNGTAASIDNLSPGDRVKLTIGAEGKATFIKASRFIEDEDKKNKPKHKKDHDDDDDDEDEVEEDD